MSSVGSPVAVIGPGAIGGAICGALVQAGASPIIGARTGFERLVVDYPAGRVEAPARCLVDPGRAEQAEVVIVAVKAHQTVDAADWLRALVGPETTVVIAQNGIEQVDRVQPFVPASAQLVPAVIWCPAERTGPGRITVTGPANLLVPAGAGADRLAALLDGSFFGVRISSDWKTRAWDKLLLNAALGAVGVLTGRSGSDMCADPDARALLLRLMDEAAEVGRAEGATIAEDRPQQLIEALLRGGRGHVSSIVVDRLAGQPTEWDARNAVIARFADRHGIEVPLNRWLTAMIRLGEPSG